MCFLAGEEAPVTGGGGQRLVTADGTYATQSAFSQPGLTAGLAKQSEEKR
jgi:hypothetical protein